KDAAEGLIVATPWFVDRNDPKVKAFVAKYEKAYGKKPDQFAAQAYDALYIMADALKRAGKADRTALRDALASTRNFQGVLGTFSFDAERDVVMEPNVLIIKGGKFQIFN
ncbi:MAG: branched-chain amino acid transporter substrate-binding protein, partial [Deltaproteobacteria bacterium]|nr:branched-chain amino acid transporter substrate-binding protein [Deltaproteobacteria bacterium]